MNTTYFGTENSNEHLMYNAGEKFKEEKHPTLSWPTSNDFMSNLTSVGQAIWPSIPLNDNVPLDPLFWQTSQHAIKQEWSFNPMFMQPMPFMMPPTPPVSSPDQQVNTNLSSSVSSSSSSSSSSVSSTHQNRKPSLTEPMQQETTTTTTTPTSLSNSPQVPTSSTKNRGIRRKSSEGHTARTYRKRASSYPSVASVVSLSAHEPVARLIDGIEHITFLYSHDRLVKEYTVRTDVDSVCLDDIPLSFRMQNAIYPRANVPKEEYDGNRWEYETSCNKLGWELCWLNQDQLVGRRGLIQRAVDSYRNRHADMRSRRVTRQEKVANGTLRKRRAKKCP
ncbi:hypothetical protein CU098_006459 [Rhizopus stolonifer]|uniref:DUF8032 domain-containing protein n=1 Tax=Rhizopus stolonifer TaxID=4846 RepID=A0A367KVS9_RHIST|nr:hypothetical protein CU098_006459 [Rhizopus stolonifer]